MIITVFLKVLKLLNILGNSVYLIVNIINLDISFKNSDRFYLKKYTLQIINGILMFVGMNIVYQWQEYYI